MVNAYIGNNYKLTFPLLCNGYLNINYDEIVTHPTAAVESSGVLVNGAKSANAGDTIAVDTVDATTKFSIGDTVYDDTGASVGIVETITSVLITLVANNSVALANNENLKKNITTTKNLRNRPLWNHEDSFTIEAIITPYDVNGSADRTVLSYNSSNVATDEQKNGNLLSTKTSPYPSDNFSNRATTYESVSILGTSNYLTQKLMLFHNANVKLYLQNTTLSSYNQPAEYKIVAEVKDSNDATKTISSDVLIKAEDTLFNYYDASGFYVNNSTNRKRITTGGSAASGPTGTITVATNSLPSNTLAISATATIDINGTGNGHTVGADTGIAFATGQITVKNVIGNTNNASENKELIIYDNGTGNSDTYKFYPRTSGANGASLSVSNFGANAFGYRSEGSVQTCTSNLVAAINGASHLDITASSATPSSGVISLVADVPHSNYNNTITIGSALSDSDYIVTGMVNGSEGTVVNKFITITDHAGLVKNYKASDSSSQGTGTTGTSGSTAVVYYRNASDVNSTANNLRSAILSSNGHGSSKFSVSTNNPLTLTSQATGVAGNSSGASTAISDTGLTPSNNFSYTQFTGGADATTSNKHLKLVSPNGTIKLYHAASSSAEAQDSTDGTFVYFRIGSNTTNTAANLRTAINSSNGHGSGIFSITHSGAVLTLSSVQAGTSMAFTAPNGDSGHYTLSAISTGNLKVLNIPASANNASALTSKIGVGSKIYNALGTLLGTTTAVTNTTITLDTNIDDTISNLQTLYTEQLKEALYLEQTYKISLVYKKLGKIELYLNNELVVSEKHTLNTVQLDTSDCQIGRGSNNQEQFFGELYEIIYAKTSSPSPNIHTLKTGYSDTLFYYTFGG